MRHNLTDAAHGTRECANEYGAGATANLAFSQSDPTVTPALLCAVVEGVTFNTTVAPNGSLRFGHGTEKLLPEPFNMYTTERPEFCAGLRCFYPYRHLRTVNVPLSASS
jgi:hypothetical protein